MDAEEVLLTFLYTLVTPGTICSSITNSSSVHFFATSALTLLFSATLYFFLIRIVSTISR